MLRSVCAVVVLVAVAAACLRAYMWNRCTYSGDVRLHGKTAIVTGANSGIGKVTALDLARRGARVILACRSLQKAEDAAREIRTRTGNAEVVVRHLDLSSLASVRQFARVINESEHRLDILINNAGIAFAVEGKVTVDNFHPVFGTNHFGHFLLTNLLLDLLKKSAPSRVVTVSSKAHTATSEMTVDDLARGPGRDNGGALYPALRDYPTSKLANVLFARELARRAGPSGVLSVSLHPGIVYTPIWEKSLDSFRVMKKIWDLGNPLFRFFFIDDEAGAQTTLHCALDESVNQLPGAYFDNCAPVAPSALAQDDQLAEKLWDISCQATGLQC